MNEHLTQQQLIDYQFKLAGAAGLNAARLHLDECAHCRQRLEKLVRKFAALELLRGEVKAPEELLSKTVASATQARPAQRIWLYRVPALGAVAAAVVAGAALLLVSYARQDRPMTVTALRNRPAPSAAPAPSADQDSALHKDKAMSLVAEEGVGRAELAPESQSLSSDARQISAEPGAAGRVGLASPEPIRQVASAAAGNVEAGDPARGRRVKGGEGLLPSNRGQDARDTKNKAETASPRMPDGVTTNAPAAATPVAHAPEAEEPPPFAPASAIELVVLPRRESVQLTIYNGADLTLVRERRNLTLKPGWNWLQFMWANTLIDPTSLSLEPLEHQDAVQVQQLVFPPRLRELGRWLIHSKIGGSVLFELTYFTSGLAWRAFYMGTLAQDEKTMHLEGYVRIANSSGEDYENAQTRLLVGRVHLLDQIAALAKRQYPYGPDAPARQRELTDLTTDRLEVAKKIPLLGDVPILGRLEERLSRKDIRKEGLSEYFLYTIEGTETIPNQWGKRLLSFATDDIPVTSRYKYDEERWGGQALRFLSFANDPNHKLGTTPLPNGTVRVYGRADGEGHLSYVGAMEVKYIPVGEKIELNLGRDRLVKVEPILMDTRTANHVFDKKGNVAGWDDVQTWRIEIANTRALPADVEVTRGFGSPSWTLKQENPGVSYEKYDATHARFKTTVAPQSERVFEYTVTIYRGSRQEVSVPR